MIASVATRFDLMALVRAFEQAEADYAANLPLPPAAPMSEADALAALTAAQPKIAALDAWVKAHPGAIRAAGRILTELGAQGFTWATELDTALSAGPGGLAAADSWLPTVIGGLGMFQPAATGIQGDGHSTMWQS
jgi:hypothetical protein